MRANAAAIAIALVTSLVATASGVTDSVDRGKAMLLQARSLAGKGQVDAAEELIVSAGELMPLSPEPLMLRGNLEAFLRRQPELALDLYRSSLDLQPTYEAAFFLGKAYGMLEQWEDAADAFRSAAEMAPRNPAPLSELGAVAVRLGDWQSAKEALEAAASLLPHSPQALLALAQAASQLGTASEAIEACRTLNELHPWHAQYMLFFAQVTIPSLPVPYGAQSCPCRASPARSVLAHCGAE